MSGTRLLLLAILGISLLTPGAFVTAQEALPPPPGSVGEGLPRDDPSEGERAQGEAEPRSPFEDHIETDRDAFTPSMKTAPVNRLIMESSYSFIDNRGAPDTHSFPELLFRYGLTKRLELRLG